MEHGMPLEAKYEQTACVVSYLIELDKHDETTEAGRDVWYATYAARLSERQGD